MRFGKTLSAITGLATGLAIGFLLWGLPFEELKSASVNISAELSQTQAWLRDEIQWSDERHERLTATLRKALTDLAKAEAQITQANAALSAGAAPSASPRQPPVGASEFR